MFETLLIANRGEIACRIIRTARRMGIRCVAVFSDADRAAAHVRLADQALHIGPATATESYLDVEKIIGAAKQSGAQAIHPGYGFLSENAALAEACAASGIVFVGPSADAIRLMGSKAGAKALMQGWGVPLTPGYHGDDQDPARLAREADRVGYPVLIKASAGGGGKGLRLVLDPADFAEALAACRREAISSFGSDHVIIERYVTNPRHIEFQIFGDRHGNYVHLFERDCSVQRRHQKVLEEAPAPGMTPARRAEMAACALQAARAVDYCGAGTVEFIVDPKGPFYFMEMNTRLQVEHPVTEMITGVDLVEWQLRVAAGEKLPRLQSELELSGHAVEARIYAENPSAGFVPCVGRILHLAAPPADGGIRLDSGVETGDLVSSHYDPMLAKLIAWGRDRGECLARLALALEQLELVGVGNNVEFLTRLVRAPSFVDARLHTGLIEQELAALVPKRGATPETVWLAAAASELMHRQAQCARATSAPWGSCEGWRIGYPASQWIALRHAREWCEVRATYVGANEYEVNLQLQDSPSVKRRLHVHASAEHRLKLGVDDTVLGVTVVRTGERLHVLLGSARWEVELFEAASKDGELEPEGLLAPLPGMVVAHLVPVGTKVEPGTPLIVLAAMKMEFVIRAPRAGAVTRYAYAVGEQVSDGAELVFLEEAVP
jgi:3-methylcrotonyl-CoA carboxylase alpha subunit